MPLDLTEIIWLLILGLAAGALGGMLGIGGSIIMIPGLTLLLHRNHHLSQAVAMIVNVFVAMPAMFQHHRAKAVQWPIVKTMLPFGVAFIIIGVLSSNRFSGDTLERVFGVFLLYMVISNIWELVSRKQEPQPQEQRTCWPLIGGIGAATGFTAGMLGIGGGNIAVPMLQRFAKLPLRQCIATTAAFMCVSSSIGAVVKNSGLKSLGLDWRESLTIAAFLIPTAVIGGLLGGRLTHALPLPWVRVAFILLLMWASASMLGLV